MVTVWMYSKKTKYSKRIKTQKHVLEHFPNWCEMVEICREDNIRASDFIHQALNKDRTRFVGKVLVGNVNESDGNRVGTMFYIICDRPTYEELTR